jgi:hypothetical protein
MLQQLKRQLTVVAGNVSLTTFSGVCPDAACGAS